MIIFEGDHTGNMITLSPLDIEDHHKESNRDVRQLGEMAAREVDQIWKREPIAIDRVCP